MVDRPGSCIPDKLKWLQHRIIIMVVVLENCIWGKGPSHHLFVDDVLNLHTLTSDLRAETQTPQPNSSPQLVPQQSPARVSDKPASEKAVDSSTRVIDPM